MPNHGYLPDLAATVLQPGFEGTTVPGWVRRWLADGLGGVALFARIVETPALAIGLRQLREVPRRVILIPALQSFKLGFVCHWMAPT